MKVQFESVTIGVTRHLAVLFAAAAFISAAPYTYCEYIRATGKDELILVSQETEVGMGMSIAKSAEKRFGLYPDDAVQVRINTIGQKIAAVSDRPTLAYSFKVLEGAELEQDERMNAFAAPGGFVYIFKEMVDFLGSDGAIASVLAHEVAHVCAKDSVRKLQGSLGTMGLQILAAASKTDRRTYAKTQAAIGQLMMHYDREAEVRADKLSVEYMRRAGYDPEVAIEFMTRMLEKKMSDPVKGYSYYRSHPYVSERIAIIKQESRGAMDFDDYINLQVDEKF